MASHYRGKRRPFPFPTLLAILAICIAFLYWSNRSLQVDHYTHTDSSLPDGFDGCRIAVISDLQSIEFGSGNRRLLHAIAAEEPEYIFLVGDLLDRFRDIPEDYVETIADSLAAIAPTYYVTGNHEWAAGDVKELKNTLTDCGVTVLSNAFLPLERGGDVLLLAGIDDPNGYADQKTPEELAAEVTAAGGDPWWILLAHRNDRFATQYSLLGADLVISGHGHGGIIRLPFTDGLVSHNFDLFPSYMAGFYEENDSTLFVTRGLGNSAPAFRLFNRPQVALLTLEKG